MHVRWSPIHQAEANGAVQKSSKVFSALACVLSIIRVKFCLSVLSVRTNSGLCSTKKKIYSGKIGPVKNGELNVTTEFVVFVFYLDHIYARKTFLWLQLLRWHMHFFGLHKISNQLSIFWISEMNATMWSSWVRIPGNAWKYKMFTLNDFPFCFVLCCITLHSNVFNPLVVFSHFWLFQFFL